MPGPARPPNPRSDRSARPGRLRVILAVLVVAGLVGTSGCGLPGLSTILGASSSDWLASSLKQQIGREVTIGSASVDAAGTFEIASLVVPPAGDGPSSVRIPRITGSMDMTGITSGAIAFRDLTIHQPELVDHRNEGSDLAGMIRRLFQPMSSSWGFTLRPAVETLAIQGGRYVLPAGADHVGLSIEGADLMLRDPAGTVVAVSASVLRIDLERAGDGSASRDPGPTRLEDLTARLEITPERVTIEALTGRVVGPAVRSVRLGKARLTAAGESWTLESREFELEGERYDIRARLLPPWTAPTVEGTLRRRRQALGPRLEGLFGTDGGLECRVDGDLEIAFRVHRSQVETTYTLIPRTRGRLSPRGRPREGLEIRPGGRVELCGDEVRLVDLGLGTPLGSVTVEATLVQDGSRWKVTRGRVETPSGTFDLGGALASRGREPVHLVLSSRRFYLAGLPGNSILQGRAPVRLELGGSPGSIRVDGRLDLAGCATGPLPGLGPARFETGSLRLRGGDLELEPSRVLVADLPFEVEGPVGSPGGRAGSLLVRGTLPLDRLVPPATGQARLEGTIAWSPDGPRFSGRWSSPEIGIPVAGTSLRIRNVTGHGIADRSGVRVDLTRGTAFDAPLEATLVQPATGEREYRFRIRGVPLVPFLTSRGVDLFVTAGTLSIYFEGRGPGSAGRGRGILWFEKVELDGRRIPAVRQARRDLENSQVTSGLLTLLLGGGGLGALGTVFATRTLSSRQFVDAIDRVHSLGNIRIDMSRNHDQMVFDPVRGDRIDGNLVVAGPAGRLQGRLRTLWLGDARLRGIRIHGTGSRPEMDLEGGEAKVMEGRPPLGRTLRPPELERPLTSAPPPRALILPRARDGRELLDALRSPGSRRPRRGVPPAPWDESGKGPPRRSPGRERSGTSRQGREILDSIR